MQKRKRKRKLLGNGVLTKKKSFFYLTSYHLVFFINSNFFTISIRLWKKYLKKLLKKNILIHNFSSNFLQFLWDYESFY
jgi:hypothetical protein